MNYFELYNLPISFHPDQNLVKQQFYALSKKFHPDFYINESEEKQAEVLEFSTLNNKAFQVLKDPQKRLHYVLSIEGELIEGESYTLPQSFLLEMMDINEALMELSFDEDQAKLDEVKSQIAEVEVSLFDELEKLTNAFDGTSPEERSNLLKSIKDIFYRNKYIARIKEKMQ